MTETQEKKTTVMAFRILDDTKLALLKRAKPAETPSALMRRVVDKFLEKKD